jgi:hypothetical protein
MRPGAQKRFLPMWVAFMKGRKRKRKKKQSSFTTLHGIVLSVSIGLFVGLLFLLVALYWHPPE